ALDDNRSLQGQLEEALDKLKGQTSGEEDSPSDAEPVPCPDGQETHETSQQEEVGTMVEIEDLTKKLQETVEQLAHVEQQLQQMEDEKMEWQARETSMRCRVEELESSVQVLTADLDNDRQHICTLSEALETAEHGETNARNSLQRLQNRVDELISSLAVSCGIIFSASEQQIERFSRLCLDTLLALVELSPPAPPLFDRLSTGLKAISDDFVRSDQRRVQAEQLVRELSTLLNGTVEEVEAFKVKVDSARAALEAEKKLREEVERRSLESADECDILRSTITALTNQLEEAQLHLSQLLMARETGENGRGAEANSTDDDKNSSDDARTEQQIAMFREKVSSLEAELEGERSLREAAKRSADSLTAELATMHEATSEKARTVEERTRTNEAELDRTKEELKDAQERLEKLTEEASQERTQTETLRHQLEEKSAFIEQLHSTLDDMVDRANRQVIIHGPFLYNVSCTNTNGVFAHADDGCSLLCRLLRCLEVLVKDFSKAEEIENQVSGMKMSEDVTERCIRNIVQQLLNTVRTVGSREHQPNHVVSVEERPVALASPSPASDSDAGRQASDEDSLIKAKDAEIRERDEKIVKLKSLLMKMKKELVALTSAQQQQQQPPPSVLANNIQSLQTEYDKAVDSLEAEKKLTRDLQLKVAQTVDRVAEMELKSSQLEDDKRQLIAKVEQAEQNAQDAAQAKAEAEAQVLLAMNELDKARTEMDRLRQELSQQIQNVTALQVEASALQQQVELGRSAINDAQQLDERSKQLEHEAKLARERLEELVTSKAHLELRLADAEREAAEVDRLRGRCDQLEDARASLAREVAEGVRHLEESESRVREMAARLADEQEALRLSQLQVAERVQEVQQLQGSLQSQRDAQSRLVRTLDGKAAALKKDYDTVKLELDETKKEFEAYKIKVHSMIKIKKPTKNKEVIDDSVVTSLKLKIDALNQELCISKTEFEAVHGQLSRLQNRYDSLQRDTSQRNEEFKKRLDLALEEREKEVRNALLKQETSKLEEAAALYRDELARREQAQKTVVEILEEKLIEVRAELDAVRETSRTREAANRSPDLHNVSCNDVFLEPVRQPAEGSESTEAVSAPRTLPFDVIPTSGFQPLDKLLEHQEVPSFETFESVTSRLEEALKRIDHFTELLNESEVNNLRLSEQVRVLKEEVRRLERNKERDEQFGNLEYLKNVVLKYLTMRSERERLVPVLVTMLKLSPDEKRALHQGEQGWLPKFL
ncbi:hypothetical protein BIW11_10062, partial [Tropilaelaps mercedesae]